MLTCSGGDSALAADECARLGLAAAPVRAGDRGAARATCCPMPPRSAIRSTTRRSSGETSSASATSWWPSARTRPSTGSSSTTTRRPTPAAAGRGRRCARESGRALRRPTRPCWSRRRSPSCSTRTPPSSSSTTGTPAVAGLRTGLACAAALDAPRRTRRGSARSGRRRAGRVPPSAPRTAANGRRWLPEHEAKELLRGGGLAVVEGRLVDGEDDAVACLSELGGRVAVKLSAPTVQHKAELGGLVLDVVTDDGVREAHRRMAGLGVEGAQVLVERMAPPGAELLVAARADAVVPCLVIGAGGIWTEALDDAAVVPLPATARARRGGDPELRVAPLLTGARGAPAVDVAAARTARRGRRCAAPGARPRAARAQPGDRARARRGRGRRGGGRAGRRLGEPVVR